METEASAEAVLTENGRILAVGEERYLRSLGGRRTEEIDLEGGTLMPGIVGGSCRFLRDAENALRLNLSDALGSDDPPDLARLVRLLCDFERLYPDTPGGFLVAFGLPLPYGDALLSDPEDIYELFPYRPLVVLEAGEAVCFLNRPAVEKWHIDTASHGILPGNVALRLLATLPEPSLAARRHALTVTARRYASRGITTLYECNMEARHLPWLRALRRERDIAQNLFADAALTDYEAIKRAYPSPTDRFTLRGIHLELDGSPFRGRADMRPTPVFFSDMPETPARELLSDSLRYTDRALSLALYMALSEGCGISFGAHGDSAAEQVTRVCTAMNRIRPDFGRLRPLLTESVFLCPEGNRPEQMRQCGICPVFSMNRLHTDAASLIHTVGWQKAGAACPAGSAEQVRLPFALDAASGTDLPDPFAAAAFAATREDAAGRPIGSSESVPAFHAWRAMTLMPAFLLGIETVSGSIRAGKSANFLWFEDDPTRPESSRPTLRGVFIKDELCRTDTQTDFSTHSSRVLNIYNLFMN